MRWCELKVGDTISKGPLESDVDTYLVLSITEDTRLDRLITIRVVDLVTAEVMMQAKPSYVHLDPEYVILRGSETLILAMDGRA